MITIILLIFYIGFIFGLYIMEWLNLRYNFTLYRASPFGIVLSLLLSPILFPIQLIKFISK